MARTAMVTGAKIPELIQFIDILGVRVHMVQIPEVVELMRHWIGGERHRCHHIVNTGMHGIMEGYKDPNFKAILNSADLFFPDGISVILIARFRGFSVKKRATGPELMREFCKLAAIRGYKNFFYGDTEETLQLLARGLLREFPNLQVVGLYSPPFRPLTPEEDAEAVRTINEAKADVLWVGMGCPKQERWIFDHRDRLKVPVAIGVGAYFTFLSGKVRRAPTWMCECGLEWFWRVLHEPRRLWRRVLLDGPRFVCLALLELKGLRKYD